MLSLQRVIWNAVHGVYENEAEARQYNPHLTEQEWDVVRVAVGDDWSGVGWEGAGMPAFLVPSGREN
jgi:hypothetical protein